MSIGKKVNRLDRHKWLSNLASTLIVNRRISTTLDKAKALRVYIEPLISKARKDTAFSRRQVYAYLQDKTAANLLFQLAARKEANRPGGYTRIIKLNNRVSDNAEMVLIELIDDQESYIGSDAASEAIPSRRKRNSSVPSIAEHTLHYKTVEVRSGYNDEKLQVLFAPSPYLSDERNIWKLRDVVGKELFIENLRRNGLKLDENFIILLLQESDKTFVFTHDFKKVFDVKSSVHDESEQLKELSILDSLKLLTIDEMETVIEKSQLSL